MPPSVTPFFDTTTNTYSYVVRDPASAACAIIDAVLDFNPANGRITTDSADAIAAHVQREGLTVAWLLDTHVHADHLSASRYLQRRLGGRTGIGALVTRTQEAFAAVFHAPIPTDGRQFDELFDDGSEFEVGTLPVSVMATPGHTPGCVTYVLPGMAFVGDTLFMPDYGTARTDFPGGDATTLYRSIARILALPPDTVLHLCHDYLSDTRKEHASQATVAAQRTGNVHVHEGISEEQFVTQREARDRDLAAPRLLLPSVQFNMRGGTLPDAEGNGTHYFKLPVRGDVLDVLA